ncbi:hypothetical protein DID88_001118 [Monilinia fructigena]|uniref:Catalase n=1 Tax=Monilinia fructigena TaxID=38457 RepID=A0A395IXJ3_9HELO|nr:hypothetical protein DID88_001118 [Monilinia fructigena]
MPLWSQHALRKRESNDAQLSSTEFLNQFTLNDTNSYFTSDVGGPIQEDTSLKAGERGPTLLEDFIFRQKIQHFDHERVPERAVHARGAAASFLSEEGKETPVFVRFSTVAGSRGSADTARDVHGFATRFYTDEGNFDIVGNNIPVFFIQDAILFPDLIHAVKPSRTQPSTLHTLFWAMAGNGIPRSFRHMDGFGVHTFRLVNDSGASKLIKWHWKSKQGKASLVWEEAQVLAGKNADFHRKDLWDAIESGNGPEWELGIQVVEEEDVLKFGFDLLDPTKILPEELVPVQRIGVMKLNANPRNYFAETEQVMFQPGHIVRGIDFTDDPLLQGRIFSYLDTQLNRHGGPNFEQIPINRPRVPVHNNNRDGAGQQYIPLNTAAYSPNSVNNGYPETGKSNYYFYNSLIPAEQQFLINAIRFEASQLTSSVVKSNVLIQLNRVSHDLAKRVASVLNLPVPDEDDTYYNDNKTSSITIFGDELPTIATLNVGVLVSVKNNASLTQSGKSGNSIFYLWDATLFDGIIVANGAETLFTNGSKSTYFPADRPRQILLDAYNWGKPVGTLGNARTALTVAQISAGAGVYSNVTEVDELVKEFEAGLKTFRFVERFALDE